MRIKRVHLWVGGVIAIALLIIFWSGRHDGKVSPRTPVSDTSGSSQDHVHISDQSKAGECAGCPNDPMPPVGVSEKRSPRDDWRVRFHKCRNFLMEAAAKGNPNPDTTHLDGCEGSTPLHYAETPEDVQALLAAGADINVQDIYGVTPLHGQASLAVALPSEDRISITRILLEAGADPWIRNNRGKIALETARERNDSGVTSQMISWGLEKFFESQGKSMAEAEQHPGFQETMAKIRARPGMASRLLFELTMATMRTAPPGTAAAELFEDMER